MSLLNTSAIEVEIFWMSLDLAKETDPEMYVIIMMKDVSYSLEISSFTCNFLCGLPGSFLFYVYEMVRP